MKNYNSITVQEINKKIEEEFKKKNSERDYDKIEELTNSYLYKMELDLQAEEMKKRCLSKLPQTMTSRKWKLKRRFKPLLAVVCVAASMLAMNAFTVTAFEMDLFSTVINIINGGFSVSFPIEVKEQEIALSPNTKTDAYDMNTICKEYHFDPEVFHYLPSEFVCINYDYSEKFQHIVFTFVDQKNKNRKIIFSCRYFDDLSDMNYVSIPNDEYKFKEIMVNDSLAIFSNDSKTHEFTLVYSSKMNYWCQISSWSLEQSEMETIINSIY